MSGGQRATTAELKAERRTYCIMQVLVNIDVDDLEKAVEFYQAALPLQLARRLFGATVAELLGASSRIYLLEKRPGSSATSQGHARRCYQRHWTPVHLDFEVENIGEAAARATAAGARQETPIRDFPWGRLVLLSDPFGNGFCLLQFNGGCYEGAE